MAKYKKAQFVGFHIRPGARDNLVYMGDAAADTDIQNRCAIMRAAIVQAYELVKRLTPKPPPKPVARGVPINVVAEPVLKVFMAPEFFFRGPNGAYPVEKVSKILPELAKETKKQLRGGGYKYEDWLFVFGTAVGYQNPDETITKIVRSWPGGGGTFLEVDSVKSGLQYWDVEQYAKTKVTNVEKLPEHQIRLTLDTKERFSDQQYVTFIHGPNAERTATYDIVDVDFDDDDDDDPTKITVEVPSLSVQKDWVAEITGLTIPGRIESEGDAPYDRTVSEVRELEGEMVEVELTTPEGFVVNEKLKQSHPEQGGDFGDFTITKCGTNPASGNATITVKNPGQKRTDPCKCGCAEFKPLPNHPELCNQCTHSHAASPIRKGWTLRAVRRGFQLNITGPFTPGHFVRIRRPQAYGRAEVFNFALVQQGGSKAEKELLVYKATYSSSDYLKAPTEGLFLIEGNEKRILTPEPSDRELEVSGSGLGGESVFEIGGVTIGLEICLDHREQRLHKYFTAPGKGAGQPKPQIQLIPSLGMSIGLGPVCCRDNGLIFNVDGQRGDSVLRINDGTWSCDVHRTLVKPNEEFCPQCQAYRCTVDNHLYRTVDGTYNQPCPHCGGYTLTQFYECGRGHFRNAGGGYCPDCAPDFVPLQVFERKLKKMGPVVQHLGAPETVEMPFFQKLTVWQRNFFQEKGKLVVYPPKPIPEA